MMLPRSRAQWNALLLGVLLSGSLFIAATRVPAASSSASAPQAAPAAARPAPAFELPSVDGATVALEDRKGQVVLINVWATWCPPCQAEMPAIEAVYRQYRDQGFSVLAVNQGEEPEAVQAFMRDYGLSFPALLDQDGAVSRAYRAYSLPSSFFIDRRACSGRSILVRCRVVCWRAPSSSCCGRSPRLCIHWCRSARCGSAVVDCSSWPPLCLPA